MKEIAKCKIIGNDAQITSLMYCTGLLEIELREYAFKKFAIDLLEEGGKFKVRKLVWGDSKKKDSKVSNVEVPYSTKKHVECVQSNQRRNELYVPVDPKYAIFDAWIRGIGAFKITTREETIKEGTSYALKKLGKYADVLYIIVPTMHFESFQW